MKKYYTFLCILVAIFTLSFSSSCKKDGNSFPHGIPETVVDIDGNAYELVTIGQQVWIKQNLKTTKYKTGESIPFVKEGDITWGFLPIGAWGKFNDDNSLFNTYGVLYNWYAINDSRGICPEGFHVPLNSDWAELFDQFGGISMAGMKLKEAGLSHWYVGNTANNSSDFTALPGGYRPPTSISEDTCLVGWFWSGTGIDSQKAKAYKMSYDKDAVIETSTFKKYGLSCRCVKD